MLQARVEEALALLSSEISEKGLARAMESLVEPFLEKVGKEWERGGVSLAQAYVTGKIVELMVEGPAREELSAAPSLGTIVLGNIVDDYHSLGRRMVASCAALAGYAVVDLGNDVEPERFVDAALESGARIIGASAMTLFTARNVAYLREEIDRRAGSARIILTAGGAAFRMRPDLVAEVGAAGTADNAMASPALFARLLSVRA